jgi:hypothetical protein
MSDAPEPRNPPPREAGGKNGAPAAGRPEVPPGASDPPSGPGAQSGAAGTPGAPATPGSAGAPGAAGTATPGAARPPEEQQKAKPAPQTGREDVNEYGENRDRILVGDGGVVYAYCDIAAETFTGRDSGTGGASARSGLFVARVRADHLAKLSDVYERPPCAPPAGDRLRQDRLLYLYGAAGTGRMTLGIQLLRERVGDEIWQIRPHTALADLSQSQLAEDRGFFLVTRPGDAVTEFEVSRLRSLCADQRAYLVLIGGDEANGSTGPGELVNGLRVTPPGDGLATILFRHAARGLPPDRHGRVRELLARDDVAEWCHGGHPLADVEKVAAIVRDAVRGRIKVDALATHLALIDAEQIRTWFEEPARAPLRPLKIALTYFGGLPLQTVMDLEDRLSVLLREQAGEEQPRDLFAVSARSRLADVQAHIRVADHDDWYGSVRTEIVEFADRNWETSLSSLLSTEYPAVRPVLIAWLREMAGHADPHVQRRAASVLGTFAQDSLYMLEREVIEPWARTENEDVWYLVAAALSAPLADAGHAPRIAQLLNQWVESDEWSLVGAAAMVYGLAVAPGNPKVALNGLARIARRRGRGDGTDGGDDRWVTAAVSGILVMYLSEDVDDMVVLRSLRQWLGSKKKTERELALWSLLIIGELVEEKVAGNGAAGKKQSWPSLLRATRRPRSADTVLELMRRGLDEATWTDRMIEMLRRWFSQANDRPYLDAPLKALILALPDTRDEARRLGYHLQAWARKNPKGAAARVYSALIRSAGDGRGTGNGDAADHRNTLSPA